MLYPRILEKTIRDSLFKEQIIVIYGPRQVGKTTLIQKFYQEYKGEKKFFRADIPSEREVFRDPEPVKIMNILGNAQLVIIDEAQLIDNIGVTLKVMFDTHPEIQFIVTGSSSFDLANKIREPLTGRALEYMLYPLSYAEISNVKGELFMKQNFDNFTRFGWYPKIVDLENNKAREYLEILQNNTFYKDIFTLENIKKPIVLEKLLVFLANNIGTVVRIGSIANEIKTTEKTVERYIQILEKMFVIIRIVSFSNNKNNEAKGGYKIYFTDIGMRNSIIKNHNGLSVRNDAGNLFENFFIIERLKFLNNSRVFVNNYFWQNYQQVEVDYIESINGKLDIFECKLSHRSSKSFHIFTNEYKDKIHSSQIISKDNYSNWLT